MDVVGLVTTHEDSGAVAALTDAFVRECGVAVPRGVSPLQALADAIGGSASALCGYVFKEVGLSEAACDVVVVVAPTPRRGLVQRMHC
jgi:hypothetical protein